MMIIDELEIKETSEYSPTDNDFTKKYAEKNLEVASRSICVFKSSLSCFMFFRFIVVTIIAPNVNPIAI